MYGILMVSALLLIAGCGGGGGGRASTAAGDSSTDVSSISGAPRDLVLLGAEMVPFVATMGSARARVESDGTLDIVVDVDLASDVQAVHLHQGIAGTTGPIVGEFLPDPDVATRWNLQDFEVSSQLKLDYEDSRLYLDVHTSNHPDGEVRGQIEVDRLVRIFALTGADVVPPLDTPAWGTVAVTDFGPCGWEWGPEYLVHVNLYGVVPADVTLVAMHEGAIGENGSQLFMLERDDNDVSHWSSVTGRCLERNFSKFADFRGHYITVATTGNPEGLLRANLATRNFWDTADERFVAVGVQPADGARVPQGVSELRVEFNREVDAASVTAEHVQLVASGGDGQFGNKDDLGVVPAGVTTAANSITVDLTGLVLLNDVYAVTVRSSESDGVRDSTGNALYGNRDINSPAADFRSIFALEHSARPPVSFDQVQTSVFDTGCAFSGCHGNGDALDLSAGVAWQNLMDAASIERPDLLLVEPGNSYASYLPARLQAPFHRTHPSQGVVVSNASVQLIRRWIDEGAVSN